MKKIIALALLVSNSALASEITLSPGSSAKIYPGETSTVHCEGSSDQAPRCLIKESTYGYQVYIGSTLAVSTGSNDAAISIAIRYRNAGLCR